ncbi:MAG: hypothetical protein ACKPGF_14035 [Microcystis panniformis]
MTNKQTIYFYFTVFSHKNCVKKRFFKKHTTRVSPYGSESSASSSLSNLPGRRRANNGTRPAAASLHARTAASQQRHEASCGKPARPDGGEPATARGPAAVSLRAHHCHYVKLWGFLNYGPVI